MEGLESWNQFLKISNYLKTCSTSFPGAQSASLSTLNSLPGVLKVSSCNSTAFSPTEADGKGPCRLVAGKCSQQVPICSWHSTDLTVVSSKVLNSWFDFVLVICLYCTDIPCAWLGNLTPNSFLTWSDINFLPNWWMSKGITLFNLHFPNY